MAMSEAEELEYLRLKKRKALTASSTNVAHETGNETQAPSNRYFPELIGPDSNPFARFAAGAGGEMINLGRGAIQAGTDAVESLVNPNSRIEQETGRPQPRLPTDAIVDYVTRPLRESLQKGVSNTRKDIESSGFAGKSGAFTTNVIPSLLARRVPAALVTGLAQGASTPEGEGEDVSRIGRGTAEGLLNVAAPKIAETAIRAGRKVTSLARPGAVLNDAMGALKELPEKLQQSVYTTAQSLIDDGRKLGITLTGPEAIQQALEDLGLGAAPKLGTLQRVVENAPSGEGTMAAVTGQRAGQVDRAGRIMQRATFGQPVAPESAAQATQSAAEKAIDEVMKARTAASGPSIAAAQGESKLIPEIDDLVKEVDARIARSGEDTYLGRALKQFRTLLTQGEVDDLTGKRSLGPLITGNRETAFRLQQGYNPAAGPDQPGFIREVAAELAPLNRSFTDILRKASPDYATGLDRHIAGSPEVEQLYRGPVGRLANKQDGEVGARITSMANEFLDPDVARPATIRKLAADLGKHDKTAVQKLVGVRIGNMFDHATRNLQGGANAWGGANFVKDLMGNAQQRANLEATIKTLPNGNQMWAGWNKFATVLKATGKRKPAGSETAMNLGVQEEFSKAANLPGRLLTRPMDTIGTMFEDFAARRNAGALAQVFTHPQAALEMKKLAGVAPTSKRAQEIVRNVLLILNQAAVQSTK
jgi:hypothetical protein